MAEVTLKSVLEQVKQLPVSEQQQLREFLPRPPVAMPEFKPHSIPPGRRVKLVEPQKDRTRELAWLAQHQAEYAGQWVAIEGDELIAHGDDLIKVSTEAKDKGISNPLFARAEAPRVQYLA